MDCRTARLLLDFARPQAPELEPADAGALQSHLDRCPDCHVLARAERQFDEQLGQAMRQVETPAGLREQLLSRLEADRGDWYRRRGGHVLRAAAAAAAVLLLGWALLHWLGTRGPTINPEVVEDTYQEKMRGDRRTMAAEGLKALGVDAPLSPDLNYDLLSVPPSSAPLPGYPTLSVPQMVFDREGPPHRHAVVYIVRTQQLPQQFQGGGALPAPIGSFKLEVLKQETYTYLVLHNGEDLGWLRPADPPAA